MDTDISVFSADGGRRCRSSYEKSASAELDSMPSGGACCTNTNGSPSAKSAEAMREPIEALFSYPRSN